MLIKWTPVCLHGVSVLCGNRRGLCAGGHRGNPRLLLLATRPGQLALVPPRVRGCLPGWRRTSRGPRLHSEKGRTLYHMRAFQITDNSARTLFHYDDVIMGAIASLITSLTIVYSTIYSDADQRKHQSSTSLAFVWGIHRWPVNSPHKWPVMRKMFPFDGVIMSTVCWDWQTRTH